MISCQQLAALLLDFLARELPPEQCRLIEEHLTDCPPCVVYVETYRRTISLSRCLCDGPVPEPVLERLRTALGQSGWEGAGEA